MDGRVATGTYDGTGWGPGSKTIWEVENDSMTYTRYILQLFIIISFNLYIYKCVCVKITMHLRTYMQYI